MNQRAVAVHLRRQDGTSVRDGDASVSFTSIEPGLYAAYLSDPRLTEGAQRRLSGTPGFIFVPPGGGNPIVLPTSSSVLWEHGYCDPDVRDVYVDTYPLHAGVDGQVLLHAGRRAPARRQRRSRRSLTRGIAEDPMFSWLALPRALP